MASLNDCNFIGNCAAAPEMRTFDNGNKIASVRIAVTERFTTRDGNTQERTEWVPIVFNGRLADTAERFLSKGTPVFVSGKYRTREWTDQNGGKRFSTEIHADNLQLLGKRPESNNQPRNNGGYNDSF